MVSRLLSSAFTSAPLLLSLATLGWAGNTIAGRLAVGEVSPLVIVFMRWTIVFAILLMTKRKELPAALPMGKAAGSSLRLVISRMAKTIVHRMNTITRGDTSPTARRPAIVFPAHPNVARLRRRGADVKAELRSLETIKILFLILKM